MGVNKVELFGEPLMDITDTTATENEVLEGASFYGADGEKKQGNAHIPTLISELVNDAKYQTDDGVASLIADALKDVTFFDYKIVGSLPTSGEKGTFYLIKHNNDTSVSNPTVVIDANEYDEYLWINDRWELMGSASLDLSEYTKTELLYQMFEGISSGTKTVDAINASEYLDGGSTVYFSVNDSAKYVNMPPYTFKDEYDYAVGRLVTIVVRDKRWTQIESAFQICNVADKIWTRSMYYVGSIGGGNQVTTPWKKIITNTDLPDFDKINPSKNLINAKPIPVDNIDTETVKIDFSLNDSDYTVNVKSYIGLGYTPLSSDYRPIINLDSPVVLTEGNYELSVVKISGDGVCNASFGVVFGYVSGIYRPKYICKIGTKLEFTLTESTTIDKVYWTGFLGDESEYDLTIGFMIKKQGDGDDTYVPYKLLSMSDGGGIQQDIFETYDEFLEKVTTIEEGKRYIVLNAGQPTMIIPISYANYLALGDKVNSDNTLYYIYDKQRTRVPINANTILADYNGEQKDVQYVLDSHNEEIVELGNAELVFSSTLSTTDATYNFDKSISGYRFIYICGYWQRLSGMSVARLYVNGLIPSNFSLWLNEVTTGSYANSVTIASIGETSIVARGTSANVGVAIYGIK